MIGVLKDVIGEDLICVPECAVHHNRYFDWHRDTTRMEKSLKALHPKKDKVLVQCATYFQDNDPNGGGLTVIPGSHVSHDRFVKMYLGNPIYRIIYKIEKLLNASLFNAIEKKEGPINVLSKTGDLLLFNCSLDNRSTYIRNKNGKPVPCNGEKFAVFNVFTNDMRLARLYLEGCKNADGPYANFIRHNPLPLSLINRAKELNLKLCY